MVPGLAGGSDSIEPACYAHRRGRLLTGPSGPGPSASGASLQAGVQCPGGVAVSRRGWDVQAGEQCPGRGALSRRGWDV